MSADRPKCELCDELAILVCTKEYQGILKDILLCVEHYREVSGDERVRDWKSCDMGECQYERECGLYDTGERLYP